MTYKSPNQDRHDELDAEAFAEKLFDSWYTKSKAYKIKVAEALTRRISEKYSSPSVPATPANPEMRIEKDIFGNDKVFLDGKEITNYSGEESRIFKDDNK